MIQTDICIVGAGPGGAATALKLSYLGIPCVLIDKAVFPRDKICGDAVSGKVTTLLNRLDPQIMHRFRGYAQPIQTGIWGLRLVSPNNKKIDVPFKFDYNPEEEVAPGYVSKRIDFDHFMVEEVRRRTNIDFYDNTAIEQYERSDKGYIVKNKSGDFAVQCRLLIMANGAHSQFARHHAGLEKDPKHHAGALRAYYRNVGDMKEGFIELHFMKELIPGYFWVFPLPNNEANVGLGIRTDFISKRRLNLRKLLDEVLANHPGVKERFQNAELVDTVQGYGLPLGSKTRRISGDNFLLIGDAGHLIDPLTGEGIGNAVYSGFIAAELAQKCLAENNFSAGFLMAYDERVRRVLGSEMKLSYQLQRMLAYPRLVNVIANWITGNPRLVNIISRMYTDFELRKKLVKPTFWAKVLLGREV